MEITYEEKELPEVAKRLVGLFPDQRIWALNGEMGIGKTALIKSVCNNLGVKDSMNSPTFTIVNEYSSGDDKPIYHFDFYRLTNVRDALNIGVEEYFYSGYSCFIEWAARIGELLPDQYLEIDMKPVDSHTRHITTLLHK